MLVCLFTPRSRIGAQPQGDVGWLHRLPYHPYEVVVQRLLAGLAGVRSASGSRWVPLG